MGLARPRVMVLLEAFKVSLPFFKTNDEKSFQLLQTGWSQQLNPVVANPILNGLQLQQISLVNGDTVINHKLNRPLRGWFLTRLRSPGANIYDKQDSNLTPIVTLVLHSSAAVIVDLWVY